MDMMRTADLLIEKVKRDYPDDVSLVHIHGSYVYDDVHDRSDLDMYFVPKTERGFRLACTFILGGIGCDFWALSWPRLERIASHEENIQSIITEGKVLYYGSDEDKARFEALKAKALEAGKPEESSRLAAMKLAPAYKAWFHLQNAGTLSGIRILAIDIIYAVSGALAILNGTSIKRGRRHLKRELLYMPLVPQDFENLYDSVFLSADTELIRSSLYHLVEKTETLISKAALAAREKVPLKSAMDGWYEEMIQSYNKIYHACETGDIYTPLFAGAEFSSELESVLEYTDVTPELPDLVGSYDPENLGLMSSVTHEHQVRFEKLLSDHGLEPRRFASFGELEAFLNTL